MATHDLSHWQHTHAFDPGNRSAEPRPGTNHNSDLGHRKALPRSPPTGTIEPNPNRRNDFASGPVA